MSHKTSFILILGMLTNMCVCMYVHTGKCTPIVKSGKKNWSVCIHVHTGKCTPIVKVEKKLIRVQVPLLFPTPAATVPINSNNAESISQSLETS